MQRPALAPIGWDPNKSIQQLVVNVPPGTGKSLIVGVLWNAWAWCCVDPTLKFIYSGHDETLVLRDAFRLQSLLESEYVKKHWGDLSGKTWTKSFLLNSAKGFRLSITVRQNVTGFHADIQVVDDPYKPIDLQQGRAVTGKVLAEVSEWWKSTMGTRFVDPKKGGRVIVMQRLVEGDLAGEMIKSGRYQVLRMPMRFDPNKPFQTVLGKDWRSKEGELLAPLRYPQEAIDRLEEMLGSSAAIAAQLEQEPAPPEGSIFKEAWLQQIWNELPSRKDKWIQSWDMRFKDDPASGDWVVGQCWIQSGANYYLVDQVRGRWSFTETCLQVKLFSKKWPKALTKLIENKANGPAIVSSLKKQIPGFVLVDVDGGSSKIGRANAVQGLFEGQNVWLPEEGWLENYIFEMSRFPSSKFDDQVDATTQALMRLYAPGKRSYKDRIGA